MHMKSLRAVFQGAVVLLAASCSLLLVSPAFAAGNYCWCRDSASGACSNYRGDRVPVGGATHTADDPFSQADCNAYCSSLSSSAGHAVSAVSWDATYRATEICAAGASYGCTVGQASCSASAGSGTTPATGATTPPPSPPIHLYNPLGANTDVPAFIGRGIRGVLGVIGAVALLMFIYGGVTWMTAGGDAKRVEGAKSIIKNSVIGLLLIFFSYSLIGVFFSFFSAH